MTETKLYDADFYRGEIARIKLLLTQSITEQERERLQNNLRVAQAYLAQHERAAAPAKEEVKAITFDACYTVIRGASPGKRIGVVKYNEKGYYLTDFDETISNIEQVEAKVQWLNERLEIPADVVESMQFASCFGWDAPVAERAHAYFKK